MTDTAPKPGRDDSEHRLPDDKVKPSEPPAAPEVRPADETAAASAAPDSESPSPAQERDTEDSPAMPLTFSIPAAMLRTAPTPTSGSEQTSTGPGGTPDASADAPTRRATAPLPALASRLPAASRSDVCARTAARLDDLKTSTYGCQDRFLRSSRSKGPELAVVPGNRAPFAVTAKPFTLATLQEWWCFRQRIPCTGSTGTRAHSLNDTQIRTQQPVEIPDNAQALARDYASWLSERTGYSYDVASQTELSEAARYGLGTGAGIRLVRELTLKQGSQEGKALERWWHYHQKGSN
jgi:hypothetical protein